MAQLSINSDDFLVFIDETGHEDLNDPRYPIFGLCGCAIRGRDFFQNIERPWKNLKKQYFGGEHVLLHATKMKPDHPGIHAIGRFFRKGRFHRIGVTIDKKAELPEAMSALDAVFLSLFNKIVKLMNSVSFYPKKLTLVFENSQRLMPKIKEIVTLQSIANSRGEVVEISLNTAKKGILQSLEVADFIAQAIGAQHRNGNIENSPVRRDYGAIFHGAFGLKDFMHITQVEIN